MSRAEKRLLSLGIRLPDLPSPKGSYLLFRRAGDLVFVSGQSAFTADGAPLFPGRVGAEVTLEQGRRAAFDTGLRLLAILKEAAGDLDRVEIVKVTGYIASAADFFQQTAVLNALSDLFFDVLGERGRHARAAIATGTLAFNCPVEAELVARIVE